jgi:RimJ/RimL family protein N-acetyltransferase
VTGVWAVTDPANFASCRVLERLGMRLEREGEFDGKPSRVYRLRRAEGRPTREAPGAAG